MDEIREKRKAQLKRQAQYDKAKKWVIWIVVAVFWLAVAYTFLGGCVGTFLKSANDPQDDYEEYVHGNLP